jgi:hypothetical protein
LANKLPIGGACLSLIVSDVTELIQIVKSCDDSYIFYKPALILTIISLSLTGILLFGEIIYTYCCGRKADDEPSRPYIGWTLSLILLLIAINIITCALASERKSA